jgi:hypothetical protein
MSNIRRTELQSRLASEFSRRGWEWDLVEGKNVIEAFASDGVRDPSQLAKRVSATYRQRVDASNADIAEAVEAAFSGVRGVKEYTGRTTVVINDHSHSLHIGAGATVNARDIVQGDKIEVDASVDRDVVLGVITELVRGGFAGEWNTDAAHDLANVLDERKDIDVDDVARVTTEVAKEERPSPGALTQMSQDIASSGLGGALAVGITQAIGALANNPPF